MERLDGSVRKALRGAGVPDAGLLADVTRAWPAAVGDAIARAAWPQRIARDGTLHVTTTSSTWAFELGLLADEILAKIAAVLDGTSPPAVRFAPGAVPAPPAAAAVVAPAAPPPPDGPTRKIAADLASAISDDDLRETIARAAAASLAKATSDHRF